MFWAAASTRPPTSRPLRSLPDDGACRDDSSIWSTFFCHGFLLFARLDVLQVSIELRHLFVELIEGLFHLLEALVERLEGVLHQLRELRHLGEVEHQPITAFSPLSSRPWTVMVRISFSGTSATTLALSQCSVQEVIDLPSCTPQKTWKWGNF